MAREIKALWPYVPTQPQWNEIPWEEARKIDRRVNRFIGHDSAFFYFTVVGVREVKVAKEN